ncbi:hypothetical protein HPB50_029270 [Hyalomma asiaticum]|nr:hypothetical protein HPB50_029270 [Hyalomma asiaticum]
MAWTYPVQHKVATALLIRRIKRKRKRSMYMRPIFDRRPIFGEYHHLVSELRRNDPEYHFKYFRMTKASFDRLLEMVYPRILHPPNHRRPIFPAERLAVTMRLLATGGCMQELAIINTLRNSQGSLACHMGMFMANSPEDRQFA